MLNNTYNTNARLVYSALLERGSSTCSDVAVNSCLSPNVVYATLRRLVKLGLAERSGGIYSPIINYDADRIIGYDPIGYRSLGERSIKDKKDYFREIM